MPKKITVTIEITQEQADALTSWNVPEGIAGPILQDRVAFLVDDACLRLGVEGEPIPVNIPTVPEGMTEDEHRQHIEALRDLDRERYAKFRAENPDLDDKLPF